MSKGLERFKEEETSFLKGGEGEPFLHKDMPEITQATKKAGIDAAFTTNAVLFNPEIAKKVLPYTSWIKVSINAGKPETYEKVHRCPKGDFKRVLDNMEAANKLRKARGYHCALGMQLVLLPQNSDEVELLARKAREIGMDYLVVKPYSQHPQSKTRIFKDIKYDKYYDMAQRLKKYNTDNFQVVFRIHTMQKWDIAVRNYKHCLALPFWAYIDSEGNLWACSMYLNKDKFKLGNIFRKSFKSIWQSRKRERLTHWAANCLNTDDCRVNCRMDEANRYLWDLTHPSAHVNFI